MRGFLRYTLHALGATGIFLLMGIFFSPFLFLAPLCLLSVLFYPLFKLLMPEMLERRGYR